MKFNGANPAHRSLANDIREGYNQLQDAMGPLLEKLETGVKVEVSLMRLVSANQELARVLSRVFSFDCNDTYAQSEALQVVLASPIDIPERGKNQYLRRALNIVFCFEPEKYTYRDFFTPGRVHYTNGMGPKLMKALQEHLTEKGLKLSMRLPDSSGDGMVVV